MPSPADSGLDGSPRSVAGPRRWLGAAAVTGGVYLLAGVVFGALAGKAASQRMVVAWRLAAWAASGVAFGAHLVFDRWRRAGSPASTALHVATGVALGALSLAAAAIAHALATQTGNLRLLTLALVAWPALTALPAFVVALGGAALLGRMRSFPPT